MNPQILIFTRINGNNVIYLWKSLNDEGVEVAATLPLEGKVTINNFYPRVPLIEYNSEANTNFINDLFIENYIFQLKKWQCIQHMKVTGKSLTFDITSIYINVQNPVWFSRKTDEIMKKANNTFDHTNVRNMWIELSGRPYPEETLELDWDTNNCCFNL